MTAEDARNQAASDRAASEGVAKGIRTAELETDPAKIAAEALKAEMGPASHMMAQVLVEAHQKGADIIVRQASALGKSQRADIEAKVEETAKEARGITQAMDVAGKVSELMLEEKDDGSSKYKDDPEGLMTALLNKLKQSDLQGTGDKPEYSASLAASLAANAAALHAQSEQATGKEQEELRELRNLAVEKAKMAGATGLSTEKLIDGKLSGIFDESISDQVSGLSGDIGTIGISGTLLGIQQRMSSPESVAAGKAAMKAFWQAVLNTQSPTPTDAEENEPGQNAMEGQVNRMVKTAEELGPKLAAALPDSMKPGAGEAAAAEYGKAAKASSTAQQAAADAEAADDKKKKSKPPVDQFAKNAWRGFGDWQEGSEGIDTSELDKKQQAQISKLVEAAAGENRDFSGADSMEEIMQLQGEMSAILGRSVSTEEMLATLDAQATAVEVPPPDASATPKPGASAAPAAQAGSTAASAAEAEQEATRAKQAAAVAQPSAATRAATTVQPVVKVYIDGKEFMAAIAGTDGVPGIMIQAIEGLKGDTLVGTNELKAATGMP
jgi:hypothetical protein